MCAVLWLAGALASAQGVLSVPSRATTGAGAPRVEVAEATLDQLQFALDAFASVGHELGIISAPAVHP